MKTIENKATELPLNDKEDKKATYFDLARICVNASPPQGLLIDDIEKRLRVLKALDGDREQADLEDADFDTLKDCVEAMHWNMVSQDIADFVNYLRQVAPD